MSKPYRNSPDWDTMRDELLHRYIDEQRRQGRLQALPEDVQFVRYLTPDEFGRVRAQCALDQGFSAHETWDGGTEYESIPADQEEAFDTALLKCEVMYPVHPRYSLPHTEEQIRKIYNYYVSHLVPCLAEEGYSVGVIPSWEEFLASYYDRPWSPYSQIQHPQTERAWRELNEKCPQGPPLDELFPRWDG